jgi:flagellar motor protein MotB
VTKERDTLQTAAHAEQTRMQAGGQRLDQLQLQIEPKLKADQKDKSIELVRDPKALHMRLNAKRLFTPNGADLSAAGGKLVCSALAPLKVIPELTVEVDAVAVDTGSGSGWQAASTRASSAADWIASNCGVSPSSVHVVAPAANATSTSLLELSVQLR